MTIATFADKANGIRSIMHRKLAKRELRWCNVKANFDDRALDVKMLDMKGNYLRYQIEFKERTA